ncbi:response regulator transcription factor [Balneolaceae bacterium ANBcel3]|nr:response regulator transcription factor [Balneolaceae bacterium ANBcel3]
MSKSVIHVGIIEDNRFMRNGWETFIGFEEDMNVVASFGSCEDAFISDKLGSIDLMIMDIGLPGMNGIEGVQSLKEHYPDMIIVMATIFDDDQHIFDALKAGAVGYLMKKVTPEELVNAIRDAYNGGSPITPNIARKVINTFHQAGDDNDLNDRELEILQNLATGSSYNAIGKKIFLSVDGVRYHIRNIYQKLQVHSRSEAIAKGITKRLIDPDIREK